MSRAPTIASVFGSKANRPTRVETHHAPTGHFGLDTPCRDDAQRIELTLPFPVSVNAMYLNVAGHGRVKSPAYRGWITEASWMVAAQKPGRIAGHYNIEITYFRPDKRGRDAPNYEKGVSDLLVSQRIITDDSLSQNIHQKWGVGGEGCRVVLTKFEGTPA